MTDTIESVWAEITDGMRFPGKESWDFQLYGSSLQEIIELRRDESIPVYRRDHTIQEESAIVRNAIMRRMHEKRTPREARKWYPGGSSDMGFLGWGESLEEVLTDDAMTLEQLDTTSETLGRRLLEIFANHKQAEADGFTLEVMSYRGFQECPFDGCMEVEAWGTTWSSMDFTLVNTRTGNGVMGPGLIAHLLIEHSFFEGKYSPYRVDPAQLHAVLFS